VLVALVLVVLIVTGIAAGSCVTIGYGCNPCPLPTAPAATLELP
jgi:hypothetical protein